MYLGNMSHCRLFPSDTYLNLAGSLTPLRTMVTHNRRGSLFMRCRNASPNTRKVCSAMPFSVEL